MLIFPLEVILFCFAFYLGRDFFGIWQKNTWKHRNKKFFVFFLAMKNAKTYYSCFLRVFFCFFVWVENFFQKQINTDTAPSFLTFNFYNKTEKWRLPLHIKLLNFWLYFDSIPLWKGAPGKSIKISLCSENLKI